MNDDVYADAASLRGQLQRGRGAAVHRASAEPGGADLVYECVLADTRWDRQTESRDAYLARLICRLDLPAAPLVRHVASHDGEDAEEIGLALDVLALLATAGRDVAAAELLRYAVAGRHWHLAVPALEAAGALRDPAVRSGLARDTAAAHDDAELDDAITGPCEPWLSFARTEPRIRRILHDRDTACSRPPRPEPPREIRAADCADLIRRIRERAGADRRRAVAELGRRGDPVVLDLAEDAGLRNAAGWTPGIAPALHHLGTGALARARSWTDSSDPALTALAAGVLADVGDHSDAPFLLRSLLAAADEGAWCAAEIPARGLGRLRIGAATDALVHVWEASVHSVARHAVLDALRGCAPDVAGGYAVEGLEDCEPQVQRAACAVAPDTASVRDQLRTLSDDPIAGDVREAARERLARLGAA